MSLHPLRTKLTAVAARGSCLILSCNFVIPPTDVFVCVCAVLLLNDLLARGRAPKRG